MPPPPDHSGGSFSGLMKLDLTRAGLAQGWIEQNQGGIELAERQKGDECGNGMKDADCQLASIDTVDRLENDVMVVNQSGNIVVLWGPDTIPAMVPEVIDDQLVVAGKQ